MRVATLAASVVLACSPTSCVSRRGSSGTLGTHQAVGKDTAVVRALNWLKNHDRYPDYGFQVKTLRSRVHRGWCVLLYPDSNPACDELGVLVFDSGDVRLMNRL